MSKHSDKSTLQTGSGQSSSRADRDATQEADLPENLLNEVPAADDDTDELLAAMADEAIDQLTSSDDESRSGDGPELNAEESAAFAEADETPSQPEPVSTAEDDEDELVTTMPTDDELDALLRGEADASVYSPPTARPSREDEDVLNDAAAAVAAELDEELGVESSPFEPGKPADGTVIKADQEQDEDDLIADGAMESRGATNATEPVSDLPPAEPISLTSSEPPAPREKASGQPLWITPLVWLNKPIESAPAWVRDVVGKVALLTILNAAAVLAYVLVIRG